MSDYKIITSGVASEYVLGELSAYLRESDYEVIEIDFHHFRGNAVPLLQNSSTQKTIYITSAHTNITLSSLKILGSKLPGYYPNCLAPIEIIPLLKPKQTIYVPHDLLSPYGDFGSEIRFLDIFDHILSPTQRDAQILSAMLPPTTQVHHAGWIKYKEMPSFSSGKINTLLFISNIEHLRIKYGSEGIVEYFKPLLTKEVTVKFPKWDGVEEIEKAMRSATEATIIPSEVNSIELISQADIVLCNSASSIHAESIFMGKPTICLLDNEGFPMEKQIERLQSLPNIYFHNYSYREPISAEILNEVRKTKKAPLLKPFDNQMVLQIIRGIVEND